MNSSCLGSNDSYSQNSASYLLEQVIPRLQAEAFIFDMDDLSIARNVAYAEHFIHYVNLLSEVQTWKGFYSATFNVLFTFTHSSSIDTGFYLLDILKLAFPCPEMFTELFSEFMNYFSSNTEPYRGHGESDIGYNARIAGGEVWEQYKRDYMTPTAESGTAIRITLQTVLAALKNPRKFIKHPVLKSVHIFLRAMLTFGVLPQLEGFGTFNEIKIFALKPFTEAPVDIMSIIVEGIEDLSNFVIACYKQKTAFPKDWQFDSADDFDVNVLKLKSMLPAFEAGRLSEFQMTKQDYLLSLTKLRETGMLLRKAQNNPFVTRIINTRLADVESMIVKTRLLTLSSKLRVEPFGVTIFGDSSIGKSRVAAFLTDIFFSVLKSEGWSPVGDEREYSIIMNVADKYQSEYQSHHLAVILDDFMNGKPAFMTDNPLDVMTRFVNNIPATALKAGVDEKGCVPLQPELVIATTNVKGLNAAAMSESPISILRRLGFVISPKVKPQYCYPGTGMVDRQRCVGTSDIWTFTVEQPLRRSCDPGNQDVTYEILKLPDGRLAEDISTEELQLMFRHYLILHRDIQNRVINIANTPGSICCHGVQQCICSKCSALAIAENGALGTFIRPLGDANLEVRLFRELSYLPFAILFSYIPDNFINIFQTFIGFRFFDICPVYIKTLLFKYFMYLCALPFVLLPISIWLCIFSLIAIYCLRAFLESYYRNRITAACIASGRRLNDLYILFTRPSARKIWLLLTCIASTGLLYKLYTTFFPSKPEKMVEGGVISINNTQSHWSPIEVKSPILDNRCQTMTVDMVKKLTKDYLVTVEYFTTKETLEYTNGLILKSGFILLPSHFVPLKSTMCYIRLGKPGSPGSTVRANLSRSDGFDILDKDLSIFYVPALGDRKDLTFLLPETTPSNQRVCHLLYTGGKAHDDIVSVQLAVEGPVPATYKKKLESDELIHGERYEYVTPFDTFSGLCGAALIAHTTKPYIHSFHVAGTRHGRLGLSSTLLFREFKEAHDFLLCRPSALELAESGVMDCTSGTSITIEPVVHTRSLFCHLGENSAFEHYGTTSVPLIRFKHSVAPTIIQESINEEFGVENCAKPPPRVQTWVHHHAALVNSTNPNPGFPSTTIDSAVKDYLLILPRVVPLLTDVNPLNLDENVNGIAHKRGIEKMNRKTSAGWPYFKAKNKICEISEDQTKMFLPPEMITNFYNKEDVWAQGIRTYEVFNQSLKDEPVALHKDVVRAFQCSNMYVSLGLRKYFLPICAQFMKYPVEFECAIGINSEGPEWDMLVKSITKFGKDRIVAGDYKNYDQRMPVGMVLAAFKLVIEIARECGYTERDLTIMRTLATEVAVPMVHVNGDLVKLFGSNPSGQSLTSFINSLVNSLYHRCCYFTMFPTTTVPFKDVVSLMTYGDDCAMSVRVGFDMNHTYMQSIFNAHGLVYTMAEKGDSSVPFINIDQLSFLKRKPVYNSNLGLYMAALDDRSIFRSLQFVCGSSLTREESAGTNIDNALREYFYHGEIPFNWFRNKIMRVVEKHDLGPFCRKLDWTYDMFQNDWLSKYSEGSPYSLVPDPSGAKTKNGRLDTDYDDIFDSEIDQYISAYPIVGCSPGGSTPIQGESGPLTNFTPDHNNTT